MDQERHDHHRTGGHLLHPDADARDRGGRLDPLPLATHRFKLDEMLDAYEVFGNAAETDALKVVLSAQ